MTDLDIGAVVRPLTPRQDRLEAEMMSVLRRGGTRSSLKLAVDEFADFARLQGMAPENALNVVTSAVYRAEPEIAARGESGVGESVTDRMTMMVRWFKTRYHRAD